MVEGVGGEVGHWFQHYEFLDFPQVLETNARKTYLLANHKQVPLTKHLSTLRSF